MRRSTALWALVALLGLMLAAGVSWATSTLTSEHIGLSSEAVTAGRRLAPPEAARSAPATTPARKPPSTKPSTSTHTATTPVTAAPAETETAPAAPAGEVGAPRRTQTSNAPGGEDGSGQSAGGSGSSAGGQQQGRDD